MDGKYDDFDISCGMCDFMCCFKIVNVWYIYVYQYYVNGDYVFLLLWI